MVQHGGEGLLEPASHVTFVRREVLPRLHPWVAGGELRPGWDHSHVQLPFVNLLTDYVPPLVEAPPPLLEVGVRCLVGGVGSAKGQVQKKRAFRNHRVLGPDQVDCVVNQVFCDVVTLRGGSGDIN